MQNEDKIQWTQVKTMTVPNVLYGFCKICGKSCKKVDGETTWKDGECECQV